MHKLTMGIHEDVKLDEIDGKYYLHTELTVEGYTNKNTYKCCTFYVSKKNEKLLFAITTYRGLTRKQEIEFNNFVEAHQGEIEDMIIKQAKENKNIRVRASVHGLLQKN